MALMLAMSLLTCVMIVLPAENKHLVFVNQNGIVNLYMYLISYFFEPYSKEDVVVYEEENDLDTKIVQDQISPD